MKLFIRSNLGCAFLICLFSLSAVGQDETSKTQDEVLAADLKLLQGNWELMQENTRSVKTIEGNKETVRRYDRRTGELRREHTVTFELSQSGDVRVCTFFLEPGGRGVSFIYKVDNENFYDIPGLLHGDRFQNYQEQPQLWHWKRVADKDVKDTTSSK